MTRTQFSRMLLILAIFTLLAFASQTQVGASEGLASQAPLCHVPDDPSHPVLVIQPDARQYLDHVAHGDDPCDVASLNTTVYPVHPRLIAIAGALLVLAFIRFARAR